MIIIFKFVGYFLFFGLLGLAFANDDLRRVKNKSETPREKLSFFDVVSIFLISGTFALALPLALEEFMFKGDMGEKIFFVFAALGSFLREKIFPIIFHTMGRVANEAAKYYNKAIEEKMEKVISVDKEGNNNRDDSGKD